MNDLSREYETQLRENQIAQAEARQRVLNAAAELQYATERTCSCWTSSKNTTTRSASSSAR
jgi:hypothetical protein